MKKFFEKHVDVIALWVVISFVIFICWFVLNSTKPKPMSRAMSSSFEGYVQENIKELEARKKRLERKLKKDTSRDRAKLKVLLEDKLTYQGFLLKGVKNEEAKAHFKEKIRKIERVISIYQSEIDNDEAAKEIRNIEKRLKEFKNMAKGKEQPKEESK